MPDASLFVLQHALGLDQYGQREGREYRNHFVAEQDGGGDWDRCVEHESAGRMKRHGPSALYGGPSSYCFVVTGAGREFVRVSSPKPPVLTRSQKRYREWRRVSDAYPDLTFGAFLKQGMEHGR